VLLNGQRMTVCCGWLSNLLGCTEGSVAVRRPIEPSQSCGELQGIPSFKAVGIICSSRTVKCTGLQIQCHILGLSPWPQWSKNVTLDLKACALDCTAGADDRGSTQLASSLFCVVALRVSATAKHRVTTPYLSYDHTDSAAAASDKMAVMR